MLLLQHGLRRRWQIGRQLARRELARRYRGSYLGRLWALLLPVTMLVVFTFVFGVVFQARWGAEAGDVGGYALFLLCGLLVYNLFAEAISAAPGTLAAHVNFVKRIPFPLDVLPLIPAVVAVYHLAIGLLVLILGNWALTGELHWQVALFPLVLAPLLLWVFAFAWALAALGVYFKDLNHATQPFVQMMMFLSPVFYPVTAVPESFRHLMYLNPLTFVIEGVRDTAIRAQLPDFSDLGLYTLGGAAAALAGRALFLRLQPGFADEL